MFFYIGDPAWTFGQKNSLIIYTIIYGYDYMVTNHRVKGDLGLPELQSYHIHLSIIYKVLL